MREMGRELVVTEPTSLVQVNDQCAAVEAWAERCESVPELQDANNKLAAIGEYLGRTSTEGRARVQAAMRTLEVRIGTLLGPAPTPQETGARKGAPASAPSIHRNQANDFRQMAANPDVVEEVIVESTDAKPPSRRKVMSAIRRRVTPKAEQSAEACINDGIPARPCEGFVCEANLRLAEGVRLLPELGEDIHEMIRQDLIMTKRLIRDIERNLKGRKT